ncbi:uncharacterized protein LOC127005164 [Eriocheir sinensis]|uniref:uncharacterized protein LOC127005164 n=1 Tax=Eriocheir sinensis TaxID=95602 RepID=UPI0021CAB67A|nr:uncharacterized protein LOC127005164 [Eriocheir sinensis]
MAPTSVRKKEGPVNLKEESTKSSELLNGRRRAAVTKSKTRKGHASRAHGLQKIVGRGLSAAAKAYAIAKTGIKLGGFSNMVSHALVSTTRTLLGAPCAELTGSRYQAGLSVEYKKGEDGAKCNVAINFSKTPKSGDGLQLRFRSPIDACCMAPNQEQQQEGAIRQPRFVPSYSRARIDGDGRVVLSPYGIDFLAMGRGTAATPNTNTPLLIEVDPLCQPKSEPACPAFETVPLGNSETRQPRGLIKSEHIKQEVQR